MKKISLAIEILFLLGFSQTYGQTPRKTLWLGGGTSLTSPRWSSAIDQAKAESFKFDQVNTWQYYNDTNAKGIQDWAQQFNTQMANAGQTDVLGIGHDAGGLILRYMAQLQSNNGLNAMILDGVPNQGGAVFNHLTSKGDGAQSDAQRLLNLALSYKPESKNCTTCRNIEATQSYIDYFTLPSKKDYFDQLKPGSPVITNLQTPTIPYAVIWGNENDDALGLTRLMSSWYNSGILGWDYEYLDCMRRELDQRYLTENQNFAIGTLHAIAGLAGATAKFKMTKPQGAEAVIVETFEAFVAGIRNLFDIKNKYQEILRCEFVHQALNGSWAFMNFPYTKVTTSIMVPTCFGLVNCDDCWTKYNANKDDQVFGNCLSVCSTDLLCDGYTNQTLTYLVPEPNDALYTKTEQTLAGAAKTYEAKGCNHMQESFWSYDPIKDAFTDLFFGGAGAAFVVPKN